jgi:hypothetical protein
MRDFFSDWADFNGGWLGFVMAVGLPFIGLLCGLAAIVLAVLA